MDNGKRKVLIVDDERTIADTLVTIFSSNDYEARAAYSAEGALQLISDWQPDFAIIDVVLPLMNGIDLAVLLTAQYPESRVLLFSGRSVTADLLADAATRGHEFDVLAKPVHPTLLLDSALHALSANKPRAEGRSTVSEGISLSLADPVPEAD